MGTTKLAKSFDYIIYAYNYISLEQDKEASSHHVTSNIFLSKFMPGLINTHAAVIFYI